MKKFTVGLLIAASLLTFGCSGRNAEFGIIDMQKIDTEAPIVKTIKEEFSQKMKDLQEEMRKEMEGKTEEEAKQIAEDYTAKAKLVQSENQNKLKASLESAVAQVAKEKGLGAILLKEVVPQGGTDVTEAVIEKMK